MPSRPTPDAPRYRITLFYGPEPVADAPGRVVCVFNVKKRSWKGGVQAAVEIEQEQIARIRQAIGFDPWLKTVLAVAPDAERCDYESRASDLFVQGLCALKLDLAIEAGVSQDNQTIPAEAWLVEVDHAALQQADRMKEQLLAELDIPTG